MELMNESTIQSAVPKIIETPNHFIMNTQVYDKQTLKPIPMKFSIPVLNNYSSMILDTSVHDVSKEQGNLLARDCQRIGNYKNIIKDKGLDDKVYKASTIASIISNAKNALVSPEIYIRDKDGGTDRATLWCRVSQTASSAWDNNISTWGR